MTRAITSHLSDVQVEALVAFLLEQKRPDTQDSPVPTPFPPPTGPVTIRVSDHPQLGQILVDGQDRSVYLYGGDGKNQSTCTEECARVWPPVRTRGEPKAVEGANPDMLGSIVRGDGLPQVTYSQRPLYYFVHDPEIAAATGHELQDKWGLWLALDPSGEPAQSTMPDVP
jgi:predicted lipoprotein with Yx(FWY)xxD motif